MNKDTAQDLHVTFALAVNDDKVFENNFLSSPLFKGSHGHQVVVKRGFTSASLAYNSAIDSAENDLVVLVHQDVLLPSGWLKDLMRAVSYLEGEGVRWGVLGCYGVKMIDGRPVGLGRIYANGIGVQGEVIDRPEEVQTLDEIVLIIRKSSGLRFDPSLPHFHMYGADICLDARERGLAAYVIPAYCIHNTNQIFDFPREFYASYRYIKRKWRKYLPVYTSCIKISSLDGEIYERRLHRIFRALFHRSRAPLPRVADPLGAFKDLLSCK